MSAQHGSVSYHSPTIHLYLPLFKTQDMFAQRGIEHTTFLISELSPQRLALVQGIDAWVQVRHHLHFLGAMLRVSSQAADRAKNQGKAL